MRTANNDIKLHGAITTHDLARLRARLRVGQKIPCRIEIACFGRGERERFFEETIRSCRSSASIATLWRYQAWGYTGTPPYHTRSLPFCCAQRGEEYRRHVWDLKYLTATSVTVKWN